MALPLPKLTPEQYLAIEREAEYKSEYFDGQMYAMAGGTRLHSRLQVRLASILESRLEGGGCEVYGSDMKVRTSLNGLYAYPDVTVACENPPGDPPDVITRPKLIFEILSDSTEGKDRGFKFRQYQRIESLEEYVLVSQSEPVIERFWRGPEGEWSGYSIVSGLDGMLKVCSLGIEIPLGEIYKNLRLNSPSS